MAQIEAPETRLREQRSDYRYFKVLLDGEGFDVADFDALARMVEYNINTTIQEPGSFTSRQFDWDDLSDPAATVRAVTHMKFVVRDNVMYFFPANTYHRDFCYSLFENVDNIQDAGHARVVWKVAGDYDKSSLVAGTRTIDGHSTGITIPPKESDQFRKKIIAPQLGKYFDIKSPQEER